MLLGNHETRDLSVGYKGKQGDNPGPLNRYGQSPLVFRAGTGDTPGQNLPPFGDKPAEYIGILIVYFELLGTKFTDLFLKENLALSTPAPILTVPAVHLHIHSPILPGGTIFISLIGHIYLL
jgi:hypothetical protein